MNQNHYKNFTEASDWAILDWIMIFPELKSKFTDLFTLKERADYHPENSCAEHIIKVYNRCRMIGDIDMMIAAVFHDICKLDAAKKVKDNNFFNIEEFNKKKEDRTLKTYGHAEMAAELLKDYKDEIENHYGNFDTVHFIVNNHMRIKQFKAMNYNKKYELISSPYYLKLAIFIKADDMLFDFENLFINFKLY
jgi:hypothetical protein